MQHSKRRPSRGISEFILSGISFHGVSVSSFLAHFLCNIAMFLIMCTLPPSTGVGGGEGEPSTKFLKKGSLTGPQFLEGVAGIEVSDFFQGGEVAIFR